MASRDTVLVYSPQQYFKTSICQVLLVHVLICPSAAMMLQRLTSHHLFLNHLALICFQVR